MLNNINMHHHHHYQQEQQHNSTTSSSSSSSSPAQVLLSTPNNNPSITYPNNLMLSCLYPPHDHDEQQQLLSSNSTIAPHSSSSWSHLFLRGGLSTEGVETKRRKLCSSEAKDQEGSDDHHQLHQYQQLFLSNSNIINPSFLLLHHLPDDINKPQAMLLNPNTSHETNNNLSLLYAIPPRVLPCSSPPVRSSPSSCSTEMMLDFSSLPNNINDHHSISLSSSKCNSTAKSGGVVHNYSKKAARVHQQASSSQPFLKVRKEKLGDRITALHQLVSPFGKTDTASVLLEAIGYIRFLHTQIQVLSSPYLEVVTNNNAAISPQHDDDSDCQESKPNRDLKSRGLCLVPVTCTLHVGGRNEIAGPTDDWAPAIGGGGGF